MNLGGSRTYFIKIKLLDIIEINCNSDNLCVIMTHFNLVKVVIMDI